MTDESLKGFAQEYCDLLDCRDLDGWTAQFDQNARFYGLTSHVLDPIGAKEIMASLFDAFPDSRMPWDDIIAEGDRVVIRHSFRGSQQKPFQKIAVTGKPVVVTAIVTLQVRNGKVSSAWLNADFFSLLQQLGSIPQLA